MEALLGPLQNAILPVFAFPALGFLAGIRRHFSRAAAEGVNAYVVGLALPCLLFHLLATADLTAIDWPVILAYQGSQVLLYGCGYLACRRLFGLGRVEALILGMCAAFPNHVYFILPIAEEIYGPGAREPVATMVAFDTMTMLCGTLLLLEAVSGSGRLLSTLGSIARNRLILAIVLGIGFNLAGLGLHQGVERFLALAGATAAPTSLFALGVILSGTDLRRVGGPAATITALKVIAHPLLAVLLFTLAIDPSPGWAGPAALVFAAPAASSGFILGLHYRAPVDSVAKAIIISTVLSVFVIALFA